MKTFDSNDPKLTAFALGELQGEEAAEIEAAIHADVSLAAEVEQVRQVAAMLCSGFAQEDAPRLTLQQRQAIHHRPQVAQRKLVFRGRAIWLSAGMAAAACLTLALFLTFSGRTVNFAHRDRALEQPPSSTSKSSAEIQDRFGLDTRAERLREQGGAILSDKISAANADEEKQFAPATVNEPPINTSLPSPGQQMTMTETGSSVNHVGGGRTAGGSAGLAQDLGGASGLEKERDNSAPVDARLKAAARAVTEGQSVTAVPARPDQRSGAASLRKIEQDDGRLGYSAAIANASGENYPLIIENSFLRPTESPLSTFSVDVDTASYSNVRRFITGGQLPVKDAVRIEEMINYFPYRYDPPSGDAPFIANIEVNQAPWQPEHRLVRIGLKGREIKHDMRPATNLVFLIDVSGSMRDDRKLPLVKQSVKLLVEALNADDRLAIVTYAGDAGLVMDSTYCTHVSKPEIARAIDSLSAGGSTNGAGGIQVAYDVAQQHFIKDGVNRVILCTDGDFNVGASSEADLIRMIEDKRATGVYLTILGFGSGNLQDDKMKQLSKHGNGNYAFIDTLQEGKKVLVDQLSSTLVPIARDVKVQVEFNPALVGAYRLIGYEQRIMAAQDFNDDRKDAGEIGAGHAVTALFEIIPPGDAAQAAAAPPVDELTFQRRNNDQWEIVPSDQLLIVKVRYKSIGLGATDDSIRLEFPVTDAGALLNDASSDFKFAAAVAAFGMILRDSPHKGNASLEAAAELVSADDLAHTEARADFRNLLQQTIRIMKTNE